MKLKNAVAAATIAGALGFAGLGLATGVANADDGGPWVPWVPWNPGEIVRNWVPWYPGQIAQNWVPEPWHGDDWEDGWEGDD
jgi:hypothetical protein